MNFCRPSNKTVNKTIIAVNQSLQCYCLESFSIHIIFRTLERYNDRHMATIKSGHYLGMETCFHSKLKVSLGLIEIASASTTMGCRGLWIEVVPLSSGSCILLGRVDGHTGPHPSPKSLTCWLQAPHPGTPPQLAG